MINKPVILKAKRSLISQYLLSDRTGRSHLEMVLQDYIRDRRWFRSKARHIRSCAILDIVPMHFLKSTAYVLILKVFFTAGEPETYILPLMITSANYANEVTADYPGAVIAHLKLPDENPDHICFDAMVDKNYCSFLLKSINQEKSFKGLSGEIVAKSMRAYANIHGLTESVLVPQPVKTEQTNTSVFYGHQAILKLFRCIEDGVNPELEIGRFLTERTSFTNFAPLLGFLEYRLTKKPVKSIAVLQSYVLNQGNAWQHTMDCLERYFHSIVASPINKAPPVPRKHLLSVLREPPLIAQETIGLYLKSAQLLGQRTAELHKALSSVTDDPDFAPEPFSPARQTSLYQSLRDLSMKTFQLLEERQMSCLESPDKDIERILKSKAEIIERFHSITLQEFPTVLMRCHGDYHLGQILYTGKDFIITDFEGEPARPLSERRSKISPIQDVAGMLRSFDYATQSSLNQQVLINAGRAEILQMLPQWARYWYTWVSITFLKSYLEHIKEAHLLPEDPGQMKILLDAYLLEKNIYEIDYELNNRPDWLKVPVRGILQLLESR